MGRRRILHPIKRRSFREERLDQNRQTGGVEHTLCPDPQHRLKEGHCVGDYRDSSHRWKDENYECQSGRIHRASSRVGLDGQERRQSGRISLVMPADLAEGNLWASAQHLEPDVMRTEKTASSSPGHHSLQPCRNRLNLRRRGVEPDCCKRKRSHATPELNTGRRPAFSTEYTCPLGAGVLPFFQPLTPRWIETSL